MSKLEYEKWINEQNPDDRGICFRRDEFKELRIFFAGNLDLYFWLITNHSNDRTFIIGQDNYAIWSLFDKLYQDVMEAKIFELTPDDIDWLVGMCELDDTDYHEKLKDEINFNEERNANLKNSNIYQDLVHNGTIIWRSDDYSWDVSPFFKIEPAGSSYLITFGFPKLKRELDSEEMHSLNRWKYSHMISVRLRNSGSRYNPFNNLFMKLFKELMALEPTNQIHIAEYLIDKELEEGKPLERILTKSKLF